MIKNKDQIGIRAITKPTLELKCLGIPLNDCDRRKGFAGGMTRWLLLLVAMCAGWATINLKHEFASTQLRERARCSLIKTHQVSAKEGSRDGTWASDHSDDKNSGCCEARR